MYNSTFDMKKIRNVVVCTLDMDNTIKSRFAINHLTQYRYWTRKPSLEVAPTALAKFLADHNNDCECWLTVTYHFEFRSVLQPRSAVPVVSERLFSSCGCDL